MVAEDDVDLEALQAQIDMSMSFAQSLVTSWIKPTRLAQLGSSGANATHVLEEELRRPPRLGVGASIPAAPPLANEASKLKRRLEKNGPKNESPAKLLSQDPRSDDEECKGRPAKRKTKVDPFRHEGNRKKKKPESEHSSSFVKNVSAHSVSLQNNLTLREYPEHNPLSEKQELRTGPGDQRVHAASEGQRSVTSVSPPSARPSVQTKFSPSLIAPCVTPSPPGPTRNVPGALLYALYMHLPHSFLDPTCSGPGKHGTPESSRDHTKSMPTCPKATPVSAPLLNLDGPPGLGAQPGNATELNKAKRKRKRRKKRRTLITGDAN